MGSICHATSASYIVSVGAKYKPATLGICPTRWTSAHTNIHRHCLHDKPNSVSARPDGSIVENNTKNVTLGPDPVRDLPPRSGTRILRWCRLRCCKQYGLQENE